MSRSLLAAALVAAIAMPADAGRKTKSGKRKGKVVRVERSRLDGSGVVRMCGQVQPDGTAYCWGKAPVEGEIATIFDETGRRANLVIRTVTPQQDTCGNTTSWILATAVQGGDISQLSYMHAALIDWEGDARTHTVQNVQIQGLRQGENVWQGFDDDGDNLADLVITSFSCDTTGTVSQTYPSGAYCMSYYRREGSTYAMMRTDIVPSC
jgi:hypothetical protein